MKDDRWDLIEYFLLRNFQDPTAAERLKKICKDKDFDKVLGALEEVKKYIDHLEAILLKIEVEENHKLNQYVKRTESQGY